VCAVACSLRFGSASGCGGGGGLRACCSSPPTALAAHLDPAWLDLLLVDNLAVVLAVAARAAPELPRPCMGPRLANAVPPRKQSSSLLVPPGRFLVGLCGFVGAPRYKFKLSPQKDKTFFELRAAFFEAIIW
jgi:hypothetical protein